MKKLFKRKTNKVINAAPTRVGVFFFAKIKEITQNEN